MTGRRGARASTGLLEKCCLLLGVQTERIRKSAGGLTVEACAKPSLDVADRAGTDACGLGELLLRQVRGGSQPLHQRTEGLHGPTLFGDQLGEPHFMATGPLRGHDQSMQPQKEHPMNTTANSELARKVYAHASAGDIEAIGDLVTPGYIENDPLPGQGTGREGVIDRFSMLYSALAPKFTIEDVIAEGDRVVVRWTNSGTHVGDFMGIPATGKSFTISGIDIYRAEDGKLAEHWHVIDQLSMLGQLGLLPAAQ